MCWPFKTTLKVLAVMVMVPSHSPALLLFRSWGQLGQSQLAPHCSVLELLVAHQLQQQGLSLCAAVPLSWFPVNSGGLEGGAGSVPKPALFFWREDFLSFKVYTFPLPAVFQGSCRVVVLYCRNAFPSGCPSLSDLWATFKIHSLNHLYYSA